MTIKLSIGPLMALGFSRSDIAALQALVSRSGGAGDTVITPLDNQMQFEEYAITPLEAIEALRGVDELRNVIYQQDTRAAELARTVDELRNELASLRNLGDLRNRIESIEDRIA